jgi:hypothetical protein
MKNKTIIWGIAAALVIAGCDINWSNDTGATKESAISLTENVWANGAVSLTNEQWFKFTATANRQYLHISVGTQTVLNLQVYDSGSNQVGEPEIFGGGSGGSDFILLTVTRGKTYYIKVTGDGSNTGAYRIGFNTMELPPGTLTTAAALTADVWADGEITSTKKEQWFKFTATAATQYLHVSFGTLSDLYVQCYDDSGAAHGSQTRLQNNIRYTFTAVTSGKEYYIQVTPYSSTGIGTYQIAFNTSNTAPQ